MRRPILIAVLAAGLLLVEFVLPFGSNGPVATTATVDVPLISAVPEAESTYISPVLPSEGDMVGATWETGEVAAVEVRALVAGTWSEWVGLRTDDEHGPDPETEEAENTVRGTDPTAFRDSSSVQFRTTGTRPSGFSAAFVDIELASPRVGAAPVTAGVAIQPRSAWDPSNSCAPRREPEEIQMGMAIIHHTGIDRNIGNRRFQESSSGTADTIATRVGGTTSPTTS